MSEPSSVRFLLEVDNNFIAVLQPPRHAMSSGLFRIVALPAIFFFPVAAPDFGAAPEDFSELRTVRTA